MKYIKTYEKKYTEDKFIDDDSKFEKGDKVKIIYNTDKSLANDINIYIVLKSQMKDPDEQPLLHNVCLIDILYELDTKSKYNQFVDEFWIRNYQLELLSDRDYKAMKYNL
jgi:hypothetical protein